MKELVFKVSPDEANLILEGLGNMPFARVYGLVEKVQRQAREQLSAESGASSASPAAQTNGVATGVHNGQ